MSYEELLAVAKANPETADFMALRMAYADSDQYDPYHRDAEAQKAFQDAWNRQDFDTALISLKRLLDGYYLGIEVHFMAATVYRELGKESQAIFHREFGAGLVKSILQSGDGLSFETAFVVLDIREEYAVVNALALQSRGQSLVEHEGSHFDILGIQKPGEDVALDMYFNIDQFFGRSGGFPS